MFLTKSKRSPFYQLIYFENEKRKIISTKGSLKSEALKFLTDFKQHLESKPKLIPITLSKFDEDYREYVKLTYSKKYLSSVELSFRQLLRAVGDMELIKLNNQILEKFLIETFNRTKSSAALYLRTLKSAFNKAVTWNYLIENPLKKIKLPKIPKKFPVFINEAELQLIIEQTKNSDLKDLFYLGFFTGMRLSEIINLKWSDIDLSQRIITIKNTASFTTKGKKERIVPISNKLLELIKRKFPKVIELNRSGNDFVFYRISGFPYTPDFVSKSFKRAVRSAKLSESIKFHVLRHAFASNLIQRGVSLYVIKELLGHEDITTTQIYSHLQQENLFNAVNLLDGEINRLKAL